jgi:hypothetical protein
VIHDIYKTKFEFRKEYKMLLNNDYGLRVKPYEGDNEGDKGKFIFHMTDLDSEAFDTDVIMIDTIVTTLDTSSKGEFTKWQNR